jgi:hypothetical protein
MGCTNLELLLDETTCLTSSSLSDPGSDAPKSSSYSSVKSVKSKRKKILLFQAGDDTAGVGQRLRCIGRRHDRESGTRGTQSVLPRGGGREERGYSGVIAIIWLNQKVGREQDGPKR